VVSINVLWKSGYISLKVEEDGWINRIRANVSTMLFGKNRTLQAAAYTGQVGTVSDLLDKGININAEVRSDALEAAAYGGNEVVVRLLLGRKKRLLPKMEAMVDITNPFCRALCAASLVGHSDLIPLLISKAPWNAEYGHRKFVYREMLKVTVNGGNMDYVRRSIEAVVKEELDRGIRVELDKSRNQELEQQIGGLEKRVQELTKESIEDIDVERIQELQDLLRIDKRRMQELDGENHHGYIQQWSKERTKELEGRIRKLKERVLELKQKQSQLGLGAKRKQELGNCIQELGEYTQEFMTHLREEDIRKGHVQELGTCIQEFHEKPIRGIRKRVRNLETRIEELGAKRTFKERKYREDIQALEEIVQKFENNLLRPEISAERKKKT